MIRLNQPDLAQDKKQQEDDGTAAIKKESDAEPVTSQGADPGTYIRFILRVFVKTHLVNGVGAHYKHSTEIQLP